MLEKISSAQVDGMMLKAASALREQKARIEELEGIISKNSRQRHAEKIASVAAARGIVAVEEVENYASELASGSENLLLVEDFVGRAAAGVPLGRKLEKTASDHEGDSGDESDVLTTFLLSSDYAG